MTASQHDPVVVQTLAPPGLAELLGRGAIREEIQKRHLFRAHFDPDMIEDKGKADPITKILVSVRITWMVVQCLSWYALNAPRDPPLDP